jgi:S-adenosylhomocysteine hydrolase
MFFDAYMDGFHIIAMDEATKYGDNFVECIGCKDVVTDKLLQL